MRYSSKDNTIFDENYHSEQYYLKTPEVSENINFNASILTRQLEENRTKIQKYSLGAIREHSFNA